MVNLLIKLLQKCWRNIRMTKYRFFLLNETSDVEILNTFLEDLEKDKIKYYINYETLNKSNKVLFVVEWNED